MTCSSSYYRANPRKLSCSWHEGGTNGIPGKRRNSREDSKVRYAEIHSEQRHSVLRALGEWRKQCRVRKFRARCQQELTAISVSLGSAQSEKRRHWQFLSWLVALAELCSTNITLAGVWGMDSSGRNHAQGGKPVWDYVRDERVQGHRPVLMQ